jgi:precorrin-8X/cobalt-precorrin-8 methylmutase
MSDMRQMTALGRRIEDESFAIIDAEVGDHGFTPDAWQVVRRIIHATADFEFKDLSVLTAESVQAGMRALHRGAPLVMDVKMIQVGLNEERMRHFGCQAHCAISDDDVIARAKLQNTTRAIEAMRKAHREGLIEGAIIVVGNAPTALLEVIRLYEQEGVRPALVIGVPVGFVSAAESKEALLTTDIPSIVTRGRKGGSTIAVAILHALMLLAREAQG